MAEVSIFFFGLKYLFRLIHMISFAFIFGNCSYDLFLERRLELNDPKKKSFVGLTVTFSILLILSGLINMYLIIREKNFIKDIHYNVWKHSLYTKVLISIFLTPLLEILVGIQQTDPIKIQDTSTVVRFSFLLLLTLYSPFLRYYREYYVSSEPENYIK
jgi:hypothetical protein